MSNVCNIVNCHTKQINDIKKDLPSTIREFLSDVCPVIIGSNAEGPGTSVVLGCDAKGRDESVVVGNFATSGGNSKNVVAGFMANAPENCSVAIGHMAETLKSGGIAIGGSCEKFRKVKNPKPSHSPLYNSVLSHGALICKKCSVLWNRDENSARNIYKIAYNAINKLERPYYMSRSNKNFSGATSVSQSGCLLEKSNKSAQPQFTRPETVKPCSSLIRQKSAF